MLKMLPADDADDIAIGILRARIKEGYQSHNRINQTLTQKTQRCAALWDGGDEWALYRLWISWQLHRLREGPDAVPVNHGVTLHLTELLAQPLLSAGRLDIVGMRPD